MCSPTKDEQVDGLKRLLKNPFLASVLLKGTDLEPVLSEAEWMP
jgi:hypothetical protein